MARPTRPPSAPHSARSLGRVGDLEVRRAAAARVEVIAVARRAAGERGGERRGTALEVGARAEHAVGVDRRARIAERDVLAEHRRDDRLIVDAGVGHHEAERLEGGGGAALEVGHRLGLAEALVGGEVDAARVGDGRDADAALGERHRGEAFEEVDARRPERFRVRHQVDLRDRHAVLGIEEAADLDDLLHGGAARRPFGAGEHRLLVVIELHRVLPPLKLVFRSGQCGARSETTSLEIRCGGNGGMQKAQSKTAERCRPAVCKFVSVEPRGVQCTVAISRSSPIAWLSAACRVSVSAIGVPSAACSA